MGRLSQMKKTMGSIPVPVADNPVRKPVLIFFFFFLKEGLSDQVFLTM
jgi:hypothetical protein